MHLKMANIYCKRAVSIGGFKDALLYFDEVVPLMGTLEFLISHFSRKHLSSEEALPRNEVELFFKITLASLPPQLRNDHFMGRLLTVSKVTLALFESGLGDSPEAERLKKEYTEVIEAFAREFELVGLPICTFPEIVSPSREQDDVAIHIASLRLVDTENVSYEQLLELRSDPETKNGLRRLRLFAYENYRDKPAAFIEDDLMTRISEYDAAVKKWGFETKSAVMTALLDSKLIAGGIAGSFLSAYMNHPLLTIASSAGAAGVAVGKIAIEIGKKRFELQKAVSENPVSYITYLKNKLDPQNGGDTKPNR